MNQTTLLNSRIKFIVPKYFIQSSPRLGYKLSIAFARKLPTKKGMSVFVININGKINLQSLRHVLLYKTVKNNVRYKIVIKWYDKL